MIGGIFYAGSGLGDQLFRYITVRSFAEKRGFDFGMVNPGYFKGMDFMKLWPLEVANEAAFTKRWNEKDVHDVQGNDIRSFDPEINFVEDNTVIDGSFEDDKYWRHNLENINKWLAVELLEVPDDLCVIGFRGGEYALFPDLFLPKTYWESAIALKRSINPNMRFEVHTDDPNLAKSFFPDFKIVDNTQISHSQHTSMGLNWRTMRYAKHAIVANSAFFILPRILKHYEDSTATTTAPRYWSRYNTKIWGRPATFYPEFTYIHAEDSDTTKPNMEK